MAANPAKDPEEAERLADLPRDDLFRQEARRLAKLPARERKAALDVHRRIADDAGLSEATRAHACHVADTLEKLIAEIRKKWLHSC
jgi:hypothetical protein